MTLYTPVHVNLDIRKIDKLANFDIDPILIWRIQNFKYTISGKSLGTLYYFLFFSITFIYSPPPSPSHSPYCNVVLCWCWCCQNGDHLGTLLLLLFSFFLQEFKDFCFIIMLSWGLSTTHQWEACQLLLSLIIEMNKTAWPPNEIIDIS